MRCRPDLHGVFLVAVAGKDAAEGELVDEVEAEEVRECLSLALLRSDGAVELLSGAGRCSFNGFSEAGEGGDELMGRRFGVQPSLYDHD
ncbi:hypothetical protein [Streptosporangium vulgare]|uniref:hypothetical protein n=1 Tax=Streptosporangium vulgare TaxID=46190 RepID=UPI0031D72963